MKRLLFGTDLSPRSERALARALRLRRGFQKSLRRLAMMKMQAAVSRARIVRPSLS